MRRPNTFIIGAPKCGTTSLCDYLAARDDVFFSSIKEPCHFNCHELQSEEFRDRSAYEALFSDANDEAVIAEGSVFSAFDTTSVPMILDYSPGARFIMALRPPADLVLSWHKQLLRSGNEPEPDPRKAWDLSELRLNGTVSVPSIRSLPLVDYPRFGALGSQLRQLYKVLPRERLFLILMEDMRTRPAEVLHELNNFLGLPNRTDQSLPFSNSGYEPYNYALQHSILKSASILKKCIGIKGRTGLVGKLIRWLGSRERYLADLENDLRDELVKHFDLEVRLLEELTGRCLAHWRTPRQ